MDLRDDGFRILIKTLPATAYFRIEIAVGAEAAAERNVDVDHRRYLSKSSVLPRNDCEVYASTV